jgi:hypothetical protein
MRFIGTLLKNNGTQSMASFIRLADINGKWSGSAMVSKQQAENLRYVHGLNQTGREQPQTGFEYPFARTLHLLVSRRTIA